MLTNSICAVIPDTLYNVKHVVQQLINTLGLKNIYLFTRDSSKELFITHSQIGIIVTCSLLDETDHSEMWQVTEWGSHLRIDLVNQHVFLCRFELLSWLSDKLSAFGEYDSQH